MDRPQADEAIRSLVKLFDNIDEDSKLDVIWKLGDWLNAYEFELNIERAKNFEPFSELPS